MVAKIAYWLLLILLLFFCFLTTVSGGIVVGNAWQQGEIVSLNTLIGVLFLFGGPILSGYIFKVLTRKIPVEMPPHG